MSQIKLPRSMFIRMFTSFTLVFICILLALSYILYVNFQKIGVNLVSGANANALSQISYSSTYLNEASKTFSISLLTNYRVQSVMYNANNDYKDIQEALVDVSKLKDANQFVHSVYVFNGTSNQFYSTWLQSSNTKDSFFDQGLVSIIDEKKQVARGKFYPILRKIPVFISADGKDIDSNQKISVLTYIFYEYEDAADRVKGAIIVNVKVDYLKALIQSLSTSGKNQGSTWILDEKGQPILGNMDQLSAEEKSAVLKPIQEKGSNAYFTTTIQGKKNLITYVTSEALNWKFIHIVPYSIIFHDMERLGWITLAFCLGILIPGIFIVFYVSKKLYSPIRGLVGKVSALPRLPSSSVENKDDIGYLSDVISMAIQQNEVSIGDKKTAFSSRRLEFLRRLISQSFDDDPIDLQSRLDQYQIRLLADKRHFAVIFMIDRYEQFMRTYSAADQDLFRYAIGNVAEEIASRFTNNCAVDLGDEVVFILEASDESYEKQLRDISLIIAELQNWIQSNLKLSMTGVIGYSVKQLQDISISYQEAVQFSKYRFIFGQGSIISSDELKHMKTDDFRPPLQLEKTFDELLVYGKYEEAIQAYEQIVAYLNHYSYDIVISYLYYLAFNIYKRIKEIELNGSTTFNIQYSTFVRMISKMETIGEINAEFHVLIRQIAESMVDSKVNRNQQIVSKVIGIIEANYMDKSLCQDSIALLLNLSKYHLGKIFRNVHGKAIAEWLMDYRLSIAAELITKPNTNVAEILDLIGWENQNYFYKMFKTKYGVTTSEYKLRNTTSENKVYDNGYPS
ncbi:helix-turn-helix domain-containing protein [Paenibacillus anseongense]|uniref:helix-turn-helix domain-containing protein n=1 Tax=Paenibacillus TaxID=44249 RepID=UPI002DBEE047|nr:helix-turn-helix domain-containing protein [Paenibacillus anseongense]MEC0267791.1 helix-turn-helix domain-containing protein [Paenibacillus anseongense]